MEFPFAGVESMYTFRANDVVGRVAPRPLRLLHPAQESVTPTEQSIDLFLAAGQPTELHLVVAAPTNSCSLSAMRALPPWCGTGSRSTSRWSPGEPRPVSEEARAAPGRAMAVTTADALTRFARAVFVRVGMPAPQAGIVADVLVWASLRGVDFHGVARIPMYVRLIDAGDLNVNPATAVEILMPGERGSRTLEGRSRNGIPLPPALLEQLNGVAARLEVPMFPSAPVQATPGRVS